MAKSMTTVDANEAVARVAFKVNEVAAIYPITPSSAMGEWMDQWASEGRKNIWDSVPHVVEMQSEGGAAGAVHGALQAGSITTTFTASQGLLLMIPNMYKIAGELTPTVFHVTARAVAAHALSIFGDHSDVMAVRQTGWAMLASNSVQEAHDLALVAQAATLEVRLPFVHFFDGFRTSHEVNKIEELDDATIRAMINDDLVRAHRMRALTPDRPMLRGTAQNPDVFFQAREAANSFYTDAPEIVQRTMDQFAGLTGRQYKLFDYFGAPDAERVIVLMGSGAEMAEECVEHLMGQGEKVGVVKVRLYRPFSAAHLVAALPKTVKTVCTLDRTKEPGAPGEPLYLDVVAALAEQVAAGAISAMPRISGGRYGLSSKEFTPAMLKGVFDEMAKDAPKNHFATGIMDDVTNNSIEYDPAFSTEDPKSVRAVFYGLGADGTVGANKNSIKIIGEGTDNFAQGYFVYDSRKSGSMTTSHLRFGPNKIRSTYLISCANFIACHQFSFMEKIDVLKLAEEGATFLLNATYEPDEVWDHLPRTAQRHIIEKKMKFYVIDGYAVARDAGMGGRINTVMQTCFFAISGILPREEAIEQIKYAIKKTYGKRGETVVEKNCAAVDMSVEHMHEVKVPTAVSSSFDLRRAVPEEAPEFVQKVTAPMLEYNGESLPVSAMPVDGTFPTATTQWEKRNIALEIPSWDPDICIQCGKCSLVCPHGVIRAKVYKEALLDGAPPAFKSVPAKWRQFPDERFTLQIAPEDCTGCTLCVQVCPVKNKREVRLKAINMTEQAPIREQEVAAWNFFQSLPQVDRNELNHGMVKDAQLLQPLFEFSGACAGCGETPYVKLMSQLFGDRAIIANATGCSSIYGGNLPTTPWSVNAEGRGPAWSNSLFEDNAEFGLGMRVTIDKQMQFAAELLTKLAPQLGDALVTAILEADQTTEPGIAEQRARVAALKEKLRGIDAPETKDLLSLADQLVKKCVWIVGGDGWAYDIGFGGLDHVLASGRNVNVLVLDTEVYSNTGGQCSKATPRGAVAKFAAGGKPGSKKDLGLMAMTYGNVYVARVAMGANDTQVMKAFREAEEYEGPSLIIAYSHCIAHGYNLAMGMQQQKAAVQSGHWPIFRFDPRHIELGRPLLHMDTKRPSIPLSDYIYKEIRYKMLTMSAPEVAKQLLREAEDDVQRTWRIYEFMATLPSDGDGTGGAKTESAETGAAEKAAPKEEDSE